MTKQYELVTVTSSRLSKEERAEVVKKVESSISEYIKETDDM